MLSKNLLKTYQQIINNAKEMVSKNVDDSDLTGNINYAAIFAHSLNEFEKISSELEKNGKVSDKQPTGDYYLLDTPMKTDFGNIKNCRVRKPDNDHPQVGYVDFEVTDYNDFKSKYVKKPGFKIINNVHGIELVELWDKNYSVKAFFPENF